MLYRPVLKAMHHVKSTLLLVTIPCVVVIVFMQGEPQHVSAQGAEIQGPFINKSVRASSFDGDVGQLRKVTNGIEVELPSDEEEEEKELENNSKPAKRFHDAVRQKKRVKGARLTSSAMPGSRLNFKGLSKPGWGVATPPDANGDVGPNHYIQTVNTAIGIFDKSGQLLAAFNFNAFFSANGGTGTACDTTNNKASDPVVLYDTLADRWLLTNHTAASFTSPWYECLAVSKTGDPVNGGWWLYALAVDPTLINDYPKLGLWTDAYYMSANMYTPSPYTFHHVRVWALDRLGMMNGTLRSVYFDIACCKKYVIPASVEGSVPPGGEPGLFASIQAPSTLNLWKFHVDWANLSNSTFTGPSPRTVASFANRTNGIPQKAGTGVGANGDHLMSPLVYRNVGGVEALWANHTVNSGTVAGIRWYEIRDPQSSPVVYQQGTFQPDGRHRWVGSLAVDGSGNMALGYSISDSTMYPAIGYVGRLASDPLGVLGQAETVLIAGTGSQTGSSAWGDYSGMTVDPSDNCTFWYTNQYYEVSGQDWQTQIGSFRFPSCSAQGNPTPTPIPLDTPTSTPTETPTQAVNPTDTPTPTPTPVQVNVPGGASAIVTCIDGGVPAVAIQNTSAFVSCP